MVPSRYKKDIKVLRERELRIARAVIEELTEEWQDTTTISDLCPWHRDTVAKALNKARTLGLAERKVTRGKTNQGGNYKLDFHTNKAYWRKVVA